MTEQASDRRFYSFWYGGELSPLAWACMSSFPRNGHALTLFSYDEIAVPAGIELGNARQVLPEDELFAFDRSFSAFSNVFRYQLLIERGGWWVDTDVYCQTPDLPACRYAWASECPDFINGAILRFPAGDPILRDLLAAARSVGTRVQQQGQLGPRLLTKHLAGLVWLDQNVLTVALGGGVSILGAGRMRGGSPEGSQRLVRPLLVDDAPLSWHR
jgi:hypothetical protein